MNYTDVNRLKYADENNESVNCFVKFDAFLDFIPFTAKKDDSMDYGRQILQECLDGIWGIIQPFKEN
jgi:hypothetical protein